MEIKPTKLVHGKGLYQLIVDNKSNEEIALENEGMTADLPKVLFVNTIDEWYSNLAYFLAYGEYPSHLLCNEKHNLKLKAINFVLWDNGLYKKGINGNFLRCIDKEQVRLLEAFHDLACGGNFQFLSRHTKFCMQDTTGQPCLRMHIVGSANPSNVSSLLVSLN